MDNKGMTVQETVERIQTVVFDILCDIDDFCQKYDIIYFLSGGTCLGAVRHQGFIPWDDDADIMLPRPDYELFLKSFQRKYSDKYEVGSVSTDRNWKRQYARISRIGTKVVSKNLNGETTGIFVDVFPIDGLPEKRIPREIFFKKTKILCGMQNACLRTSFDEAEKYKFIKRMTSYFVKPFGANYFARKMNRIASRYDFDNSKYVGAALACHYGSRETIPRNYMEKANYLQFKSRKLPVPIGYKKYLHNLYGDYMSIPADAAEKGYSHLQHWEIDFGSYFDE